MRGVEWGEVEVDVVGEVEVWDDVVGLELCCDCVEVGVVDCDVIVVEC